jgi:uncharacterized protein YdeI (YjbR/CyaY-like superfamily)
MKQRIASTTVDLPCLDADKKRAQYIKSIVYEKLKELDSALTVTVNYKQAEQKYFELLRLFEDDPEAKAKFEKLPPSHQKYYSRWIEDAKTEATKVKRIVKAIKGLSKGLDFGAMTKLD